MPKSSDPLIVKELERRAKNDALINSEYKATKDHWKTGYAMHGNIGVRYYPFCDRYAWFNETGPISKGVALREIKLGMRMSA
jgi:hypothetical protein